MSFLWLRPAYETRLGNMTAKCVLVLIADQANAEGQSIVSIDFIARLTEGSKRHVERMIQVFTTIGLVSRFDRGPKHKPGLQLNGKLLGTDMREQYAQAFRAAQGRSSGSGKRARLRDAEENVSETFECVSETRKHVSETHATVSETEPPHPHIGRPIKYPLTTHTCPPESSACEDRSSIQRAAESVMQGCGFIDPALERILCGVVDQEMDKGSAPATTALEMITAWHKYTSQDARLRFKWSAQKFFAHGYWNKPKSWPWDATVLREEELTHRF